MRQVRICRLSLKTRCQCRSPSPGSFSVLLTVARQVHSADDVAGKSAQT